MRTRAPGLRRALGVLAVSTSACVGLPPPPPGDGESSTADIDPTGGSTLVADASTSTTGPEPSTTTGPEPSTTTGPEPSTTTGPSCPPGHEGCPCDEGACIGDLVCIEDTCVAVLCGNGRLDAGESCDDANRTDSDGCDNDCTVSAGAAQVIAGDEHVCALFHTGDIKCWGAFDLGRLGYPGLADDVGNDETPADMPFVDVGAPVVQLALGTDYTCARLDGGEVKCWGNGLEGRLGQGNTEVVGDDEHPASIPPIDLGGLAVHIAVGNNHACAVLESGELRCWGRYEEGKLGLPGSGHIGNDEVPSALPAVDLGDGVVAEQVAAGADHTCVLLAGRANVLCFGRDQLGQLGTPGINDSIGDDEHPSEAPAAVQLPQEATLIAARYNHTCVTYGDGSLQCWGDGGSGRLGYGNTDTVGDDEDVALVPVVDLVGGEPTHFGLGFAHTCVRLATTQIYCWGEALNGRLGYGNVTDLLAPAMDQVNLALPLAPRMVTAGREFSCATTEGSQVKCWGRNNRGQLGYGVAWNTDLADNEPIDSVGPVEIE